VVEYVEDIKAAKRFYVDVLGLEMGRYDSTNATTNKSKSPTLENRGRALGKSSSKTNGTGLEPGILARFFAGWKPVCRQAGLALPPDLRRQQQIKPRCRARRTRRYV